MVTNIDEAKAHLSQLVDRAADGEEIVIAREGKPIARLVGYAEARRPRQGGQWAGRVRVSDDFDAPLPPEIAKAFGSESE